MQVYRELHVITARPTPDDESKAPHLGYGVLPASEACSAGRWLALAQVAIDQTIDMGKLPVVTGGTGLYIKALIEGMADIPDVPDPIRAQAIQLWQEQGEKALLERDPDMAARLKPGDTQRHTRALEVLLATGKSLAYWHELPRAKPYPEAQFSVEFIDPPREELYLRCDVRFTAMLDAGALEEVRALMALNLSPDLPALRAVGVPELIKHLKGEWTLDKAIDKAQQATRNYAKRQLTWFRHQLS